MAGNYAQLLDIINNPTDHSLPAWDNNNKLIEGLTLKQYLLTIINSLTVGYQFMGVASENTSGGTPDQNVFYIAGPGTYNGFGSNPITIDAGYIGIIRWNGAWSCDAIKIADVVGVSQNTLIIGNVATPIKAVQATKNNYTGKTSLTIGDDNFSLISGDVLDNLNNVSTEIIKQCLNYLFFKDTNDLTITGYIRQSDGQRNGVSGWHCSDYIEIDKTKDILTSGLSFDTYVSFIYFYDSSKNAISGLNKAYRSGIPNGNVLVVNASDIPSNAAYIRVSTEDALLPVTFVTQVKDSIVETLSSLENALQSEIDDLDNKYGNITTEQEIDIYGAYLDSVYAIGADAFALQGYIKPVEGTEYDTQHTNWYHTDYIKINRENNIKVVGDGNNEYVALVYFYDENKTPISGISNVTAEKTDEYIVAANVIPNNAAYIRVSTNATYRSISYAKQIGLSPSEIIEDLTQHLHLTIPDVVYAVVGTEMNLWNDAVSLSHDKGLSSPLNYQVRWQCNKGLITERCFRYTPVAADAGNTYSCHCYLYDRNGKLMDDKAFSIKVLAKNALNSAKIIAYFGDSLGASAAAQLYFNFQDNNKFTGIVPQMVGTRGETVKYDAVGGYTWSKYATEGEKAYRASVSNVTAISKGAVYSDGSHHFEVIEVNIVEGTGNILLLPYYTSLGALIMPSGTLIKISGGGDDSIPYTDAFEESGNPLWNDQTEQLDVAQYKALCGLQSTDKIDAVSFQFGINDNQLANNLPQLRAYIKSLYDAFVADNASCKFIVGLTTSAGNTLDGSGANYGATWNWKTYLENVYKIREFYLTLQNDNEMPNIRIAPSHLELDRYYGYGFSTRAISQRVSQTESYHNNYVHPTTSGYGQMGDAYFATYIGVLME